MAEPGKTETSRQDPQRLLASITNNLRNIHGLEVTMGQGGSSIQHPDDVEARERATQNALRLIGQLHPSRYDVIQALQKPNQGAPGLSPSEAEEFVEKHTELFPPLPSSETKLPSSIRGKFLESTRDRQVPMGSGKRLEPTVSTPQIRPGGKR